MGSSHESLAKQASECKSPSGFVTFTKKKCQVPRCSVTYGHAQRGARPAHAPGARPDEAFGA